jgi:hypothetical protein
MSFVLGVHPFRRVEDGVPADVHVEPGLDMFSLLEHDADRRAEANFAHSLAYEEVEFTHRGKSWAKVWGWAKVAKRRKAPSPGPFQ